MLLGYVVDVAGVVISVLVVMILGLYARTKVI